MIYLCRRRRRRSRHCNEMLRIRYSHFTMLKLCTKNGSTAINNSRPTAIIITIVAAYLL